MDDDIIIDQRQPMMNFKNGFLMDHFYRNKE